MADRMNEPDEPYVGVIGDTHGNLPWELEQVIRFRDSGVGTVLHLGDFGLGFGHPNAAKQRLTRLSKFLAAHQQTWLITPGNHDNWARIYAKVPASDGLKWFSEHVAVIPPGHRWVWHGRSIVSLGGAPSVDRDTRTPGRDWWTEELISDGEVETVLREGRADVMLTHDAPAPATRAVQHILDRNPQGWPAESLDYAAKGREQVTRAFQGVKPRLLMHGHMHVADREVVTLDGAQHPTEIISVASDEKRHNTGVLDLSTLTFTWLD